MSIEEIVTRLVALALELVTPEVLHGKVDEQAQIKAARGLADLAAREKFGVDPQ